MSHVLRFYARHNFADRDPSRESVQGVRLQLKGNKSGGFAGFPDPENVNDPSKSWPAQDLRNREMQDTKGGYKRHEGANYFGSSYSEDVHVPLEALEPDLEKQYESKEIRVSDLGLNGSAAGLWIP